MGAIDETLSAEGMIVPGLGDSGDRLFGTAHDVVPVLGTNGHQVEEEEEEAVASTPSKGTKRKSSGAV